MLGNILVKNFVLTLALAGAALAGTFGRVVAIGGAASDVALDEARGVLYIANFTANRIEIMQLADRSIRSSMNVANQPSSLALSPDRRWLLVAHFGNAAAPASPQNGLTLIDLANNNAKQSFALGNPPLGVAFGINNRALVVTTAEFISFDPVSGTTHVLDTISGVAAKTLPVPAVNFPPNIVTASVASSPDYNVIWGFGDNLEFRYDVSRNTLQGGLYTASPALAPRAVSVSRDGSYAAMGWSLLDNQLRNVAEFPSPSGILNVGSHAIDSGRGIIYSQVPTRKDEPPVLTVRDHDNLTIRERLQLPENLAGRSVLSADGNTIYGVSDSGVLVLPVGDLDRFPRVVANVEDVVFRGNFCDRRISSQNIIISDPGGNNVPFSISAGGGVTVTPSSGLTPATVRVSVDPNFFQNQKGTVVLNLNISSSAAVNLPDPVRVLINNREPDQRGTFVNIPGKLVDLQADPARDRFYVLRQDKNELYVYDASNNTAVTTLRTCTKPMGMAITFDRRYMLVGCDNAHIMNVFDLETLQAAAPIYMPGSYVQSVAASSRAILAVVRDGGGGEPLIERIDLVTRSSTRLPSLGIFENKINLNSVLTTSPNGSRILMASADGNVMLYDANVDTFTVSRKDFSTLGGAYAASAFDQFVVGANLLNSSLVPVAKLETGTGNPSGFAFLDQAAVRTTAPDSAAPGIIQRVDLTDGSGIRPTRMTEAPLLGGTGSAFTRTLAPLFSRNFIVNLTTSGFTVLPSTYDAAVATPRISRVVSAADQFSSVAPGGLITIFGSDLSPTNLATREMPVPTALGDSCLTVNGMPLPLIFVSPGQINAQLPFQAMGNVTLIVRTPGGVSDNFNFTVLPGAPAIFRSGVAGPETDLPTLVRAENGILVTDSNPIHREELVTIYLTGLGQTQVSVDAGYPAPIDPLAETTNRPRVTIGGQDLEVWYAGLAPNQVGVYQINVFVPRNVPQGLGLPFTIIQSGVSTTIPVRVVE